MLSFQADVDKYGDSRYYCSKKKSLLPGIENDMHFMMAAAEAVNPVHWRTVA